MVSCLLVINAFIKWFIVVFANVAILILIGSYWTYFILNAPVILLSHIVIAWLDSFYALILLVLAASMCAIHAILLVILLLRVHSIPLVRYSKIIQNMHRKPYSGDGMLVTRKLLKFRHIFYHTFRYYHFINHVAVSPMMAKIFTLNFASNAILFIQIDKTFTEMHISILSWFIEIVAAQFVGIGVILAIQIQARTDLYRSKNALVNMFCVTSATCGKANRKLIYNRLCLNNFIEIVHSKKTFAFTLGWYGRVTKRSLLAYVPMYTSFIMMMIVYINKEVN